MAIERYRFSSVKLTESFFGLEVIRPLTLVLNSLYHFLAFLTITNSGLIVCIFQYYICLETLNSELFELSRCNKGNNALWNLVANFFNF